MRVNRHRMQRAAATRHARMQVPQRAAATPPRADAGSAEGGRYPDTRGSRFRWLRPLRAGDPSRPP